MGTDSYIGANFRIGGQIFTVRESKHCPTSNELIFVATARNSNLVWRGTENDLEEALKSWVVMVTR